MSDAFVTPRTVAHQAPLSMGLSMQEYWNGLPFPFPRDLPNPGIEATSPALAGRFFTTEPPGKPPVWQDKLIIIKCLLFYKSPFSLKPRTHLPIHVLRSYLSFNFLASAGDLLCLSDLQTFLFKLLFFFHFNLSYVNFITRPIKECREIRGIIPPHIDKNEYANRSYNTMLIISTKNYDYCPTFKKIWELSCCDYKYADEWKLVN